MDCVKIICLYLKNYVTNDQFLSIFFKYINDFQNALEEDLFIDILSTNFCSKEEKISLDTELRNYVLSNHKFIYDDINDSYVERLIDSDGGDIVVKILKKKYEKREEVNIDCGIVNTRLELITTIKQALQYPQFCGNNWYAIEDLIYDIIFPKKLIFSNWCELKKKLPEDTDKLKEILDRNNNGRCIIIYT